MANCAQVISGLALDCLNSQGGIRKVYIANYDDVKSATAEADVVNQITMNEMAKFKTFEFRKETGSLTSTLTVDEKVGLNYVVNELTLVFTRMETAKRIEMAALAVGQLAVIVEDSNGILWGLGLKPDDYVSASAGSGNTGTAKSDGSSYSITLKSESKSFPMEVDKSVLATIVDGMA